MRLLALKGFPGSGKSTIGRALGKQWGWPVIDKDDIKDTFGEPVPSPDELAYDVLLHVVRRQLLQGLNVLCDSPLTHKTTYERLQQLAKQTDARLLVLECLCSDQEIWSQRVNARKAYGLPAHHMTDWERVQAYRHQYLVEANYTITHPHLVVDTARPLAVCMEEITMWLETV